MNLIPLEHLNQRILTTEQLAEVYETEVKHISNNFNRNKDKFTEGRHYFLLQGDELKAFKAIHLLDESLKFASQLYLWTERGANRHCKILDTDKAWEQFDRLEETYFNSREQVAVPRSLPEALRLAADLAEKNERLALETVQQKQIISELKPKATYYDLILQNKSTLSVTKIAKDYGLSAIALNQILFEEKIQFKQGDCWILYQKYADKGYTQSRTQIIDEERSKLHTYWTQKGRLFIYDLLKNKRGILPIIERSQHDKAQ